MSVTAIPNGLSRPCERLSKEESDLLSRDWPLVHDSGAARGDDTMASMANLRILYRMYDTPKSIITLTVRVSLTIETDQMCVPRRFTRNDYTSL